MSERPDSVLEVQPKTIAQYEAVKFDAVVEGSWSAVEWLAAKYGVRISERGIRTVRGKTRAALVLRTHRNKKMELLDGEYLVATKNNVRVMKARDFDNFYTEV